ncbi:MAG TPA: hypothetical protein VF613_21540, partial [Longimicrobium sp.]
GDSPAALVPLLGRAPAWEELTAALADGWREALAAEVEEGEPDERERERAAVLAEHYASPAWTWHR